MWIYLLPTIALSLAINILPYLIVEYIKFNKEEELQKPLIYRPDNKMDIIRLHKITSKEREEERIRRKQNPRIGKVKTFYTQLPKGYEN